MGAPSLSDPRNYQHRVSTALEAQPAVSEPLTDWDPQGDINPPETHFARLFVPTSERVPPMPPVPDKRPQAEAVQVQTFDTPSSQDLNAALGFPCHSVVVDNLTNQWLFFRSARRWVAPYSYGAIISFLQATQVAGFVRAAPPGGFTLPVPIAGENVQTTWMAAFNMPSSGTIVTKA